MPDYEKAIEEDQSSYQACGYSGMYNGILIYHYYYDSSFSVEGIFVTTNDFVESRS